MQFNDVVRKRLAPIFNKHSFEITQEYKDAIHFSSSNLEIIVSYNELDRMSLASVGERNNAIYPLSNKILQTVFHSKTEIENLPKEVFVDHLAIFFENEGQALLKGDIGKLNAVKTIVEAESAAYTATLLKKQSIRIADESWNSGDYPGFIELLDQMNMEDLPASYQLKYDIAKKKLGGVRE